MKIIKISGFFLACIFSFTSINAQKGETTLDIKYSAALPMGSFKTQLSENSYRGFQANVLYGVSNNFSIGLGTGYQDFYQKNPRQIYKLTNGSDISAVLTHSIQTIPVLVQAKYRFTPGAAVQPYVALGVGGNLISYSELLGQFGGNDTKFGFAARPEAGLFIPFKKMGTSGIALGASYNVMPFKQDEFTNLNHVSISAGITIPLKD